jgi:hypothetical protein
MNPNWTPSRNKRNLSALKKIERAPQGMPPRKYCSYGTLVACDFDQVTMQQ